MLDTDDLTDTLTLKAALDGPESDKWMTAICAELQNIKAEDVYELVNPACELIDNLPGNKIVLQQKCGASGVGRILVHIQPALQ